MKKITSIICMILMCAMLFAGCTNRVTTSPSPVISPTPSALVSEPPIGTDNPADNDDNPLDNDNDPLESERVPGASDNVTEASPKVSPAA